MAPMFEPGQTFGVSNTDWHIIYERWTVSAVDLPIITFSVEIYWLRDAAGIPVSSTETVVGTFLEEIVDGGVFVTFSGLLVRLEGRHFGAGFQEGLLISGDKGSYLKRLDPVVFA